eukprot:COSAG01_NODE_51451_length_354_cov_4.058824_1_plen_37_part_01
MYITCIIVLEAPFMHGWRSLSHMLCYFHYSHHLEAQC